MDREEERCALDILKQEIEISEQELRERTSQYYQDCKNIFNRISDRMYELKRIFDRNERFE